jgi:hypothetical protein
MNNIRSSFKDAWNASVEEPVAYLLNMEKTLRSEAAEGKKVRAFVQNGVFVIGVDESAEASDANINESSKNVLFYVEAVMEKLLRINILMSYEEEDEDKRRVLSSFRGEELESFNLLRMTIIDEWLLDDIRKATNKVWLGMVISDYKRYKDIALCPSGIELAIKIKEEELHSY